MALCAGLFVLGIGSILVPGLSAPAAAQARLEAKYNATLAGIPVGKGTWTVSIQEDQFSAAVTGETAGLANVFTSGSGSGTVQGLLADGALAATVYRASTVTAKKSEQVFIALDRFTVKESSIVPEPPRDPDRIPVTEAHRRAVFDPMSASLVRVPGNSDLLTPEACHASAPVFDGRMRYDLSLGFKRMETVKAEKGYRGPVLVCALYFVPVAGYIPDRPVIKYLAAERNIEVALAPMVGTRFLAPFWVKIPTPLGPARLEATHFSVLPLLPKPQ
ncbi:MAG: DUF3108 domain-containing protein [Alphaproteobacteria bacterium]|nr:DUF3108 domain-containing protein [Alphaproteobacteria bacterium]